MALNLYQYRKEIRSLLRDDSYPDSDIDMALNRVVRDINNLGRFRFHEQSYTLNLTANNYTYAVPATVLAERLMIYDLGGNNQFEVPRRREMWTGSPLVPANNGSTPVEWFRYNNNWYIVPIPDATMAANDITVLYDKDLVEFFSPTDTTALPDRHKNVLIYGAVAQLRPNLLIGSPEGEALIENLYQMAVQAMKDQENWDYESIPALRAGKRWQLASQWGHVTNIR
jgi:hypothetical protein